MKNTILFTVLSLILVSCSSVDKKTDMTQKKELDKEITNVVDQLYKSIEYRPQEGIEPDWELMKSIFIEDASLIHVMDTTLIKMKVQDFIDGYSEQINSGYTEMAAEIELSRTGDQFGKIAQIFSSYELEGVYGGQEYGKRGINSVQLLNVNGQWKVSSLIWYDENSNYSIPDEYLK